MDQEVVNQLAQNAGGAHWAVIVGVVLMVLVQIARSIFGEGLPQKYVPLFAAGLAMVSETAVLLAQSEVPWWSALLSGLVSGTSAMGFYSLLGKHIFTATAKLKKGNEKTMTKEESEHTAGE